VLAPKRVIDKIKELNLDTSHFVLVFERQNIKVLPLKDLLVNNCYRSATTFKNRILKEGLLKYICYECGQGPEYRGKYMSLDLDHINGNNKDNRLENLRILCGYCHKQTETYCRPFKKKEKRYHNCRVCDKQISVRSTLCNEHNTVHTRKAIEWPEDSHIVELVKKVGISEASVRLRVSRGGLLFRLKRLSSSF